MFELYAVELPKLHGGRVSNLRTIELKSGWLLMLRETFASAEGASRLGGFGGMLPQNIFKSESLKTQFPALSVR